MTNIFETPISFLKPEALINAEDAYATRTIDLDALRDIQDQEIAKLTKGQKEAGLEVITDGGFRNVYGLRDFWMWLQGVTPTVVTSGHVYQDQNSGEVIPRITGKIAHNTNHNILNNFSFLLREAGGDLLVRIDIPAPSQFFVELVRNGWYDTSLYANITDLVADISEAYRDTLHDLYNLGCRRILLIDPSWGRLCNPLLSKRLLQGGIDLINLAQLMRKANEDAIANIPADMHIILYSPIESPISKHCEDIVYEVLSHHRVDSFMFDWQKDDKDILAYLTQISPGKELIIGLGDPKQPNVEDLSEIATIYDKAFQANPDINVKITFRDGFVNNTDSIDFSTVAEHEQWSKIKNILKFSPTH